MVAGGSRALRGEIYGSNAVAMSIGPQDSLVHHRSSVDAKMALFRSLFRGRDDVYPRRFESRKTGRAGYQPACATERRTVCARSQRSNALRVRTGDFCPSLTMRFAGTFQARTSDGRAFVMGVYPMLQDETCFFLAADFDKTHWRQDVEAVSGNVSPDESAGCRSSVRAPATAGIFGCSSTRRCPPHWPASSVRIS